MVALFYLVFVSGCLESWKKSSTNDPLGRWESLVEHVDQAAASKKVLQTMVTLSIKMDKICTDYASFRRRKVRFP